MGALRMDMKSTYLDLRLVLAFFDRAVLQQLRSWLGLKKKPQKNIYLLRCKWLDKNRLEFVKTLAAKQ